MTAEKKDRKPLQIKNLADLKRHIKLGTELVATAHQYHPDIVGLTRVVTKVQTKELINMTYGLDSVMIAPDIWNDEQLGQFVMDWSSAPSGN